MVVRLELLPVHFVLADEVLESGVVDDRDEEEGKAVGGEADGRVNAKKEDGHIQAGGTMNSHQLEFVVELALEDGLNNVANFIERSQRNGKMQEMFDILQIATFELRFNVFFEKSIRFEFFPRPQVVDVPF